MYTLASASLFPTLVCITVWLSLRIVSLNLFFLTHSIKIMPAKPFGSWRVGFTWHVENGILGLLCGAQSRQLTSWQAVIELLLKWLWWCGVDSKGVSVGPASSLGHSTICRMLLVLLRLCHYLVISFPFHWCWPFQSSSTFWTPIVSVPGRRTCGLVPCNWCCRYRRFQLSAASGVCFEDYLNFSWWWGIRRMSTLEMFIWSSWELNFTPFWSSMLRLYVVDNCGTWICALGMVMQKSPL